jgi:hypothetical protein
MLGRLIQKVKSGPRPRIDKANVRRTPSVASSSPQDSLLKIKFPEDQLRKMSNFIVRRQASSPGDPVVYIFNFAELPAIKDPLIVPYITLSKLRDEPAPTVIFIYLLAGFDESKLPSPGLINLYSRMSLAEKIALSIPLEPNESFLSFIRKEPALLDRRNHFVFVTDLVELAGLVGQLTSELPIHTIESLTPPDSTTKAKVNGRDYTIRLHSHSIQFVSPPETFSFYEVSSIIVIMAQNIGEFTRVAQGSNMDRRFTITTRAGQVYMIASSNSSSIYEGMMSLERRSRTLQALKRVVKVDTSTLQWLMLILAFLNVIGSQEEPVVRKAALDLLYAVLAAFSIAHSKEVVRAPMEALPQNLLRFVTAISEDIAQHNEVAWDPFLSEFMKVYQYIAPAKRAATFSFLRPWIRRLGADPEPHPDTLDFFARIARELPLDGDAFMSNVWSELAHNPQTLIELNRRIFEMKDDLMLGIITQTTVLCPREIGEFWITEFFTEIAAKRNEKLIFCAIVIAHLIANHCFDCESHLSELVTHLILIRILYDEDTLQRCIPLVQNVFHYILRTRKISPVIDYAATCVAFYTSSTLEQFVGNHNLRPWLDCCCIFATSWRSVLTNSPIESVLYERFSNDISNSDPILRSVGLIFAAAFSVNRINEFIKLTMSLLAQNKDHHTIASIASAFSILPMDRLLASKLLFLSFCLLLFQCNGTILPLLSSAFRQFGSNSTLCESVNPDLVAELDRQSGLDFANDPVFSALLLVALNAEPFEEPTISEIMASGTDEPLAKVFSLVISGDALPEVSEFNFRHNFANVGIAVLLLLKIMPKSDLVQYGILLSKKTPAVFGGLRVLQGDFGQALREAVNSASFIGTLSKSSRTPKGRYKLAHVFRHFFSSDSKRIQLNEKQLDGLLSSLFD